jgi:hypothetical protein
MCKALPGLRSFSGRDFTSSFARKGKVPPYELTQKCPAYKLAFAELSVSTDYSVKCVQTLNNFVTVLYGAQKPVTLNRHRYLTVEKCYAAKRGAGPLESLRSIEASSIPPCEAELLPHIKRANFVSLMWASALSNALLKSPTVDQGGGRKTKGNSSPYISTGLNYHPLFFHT